MSKIYVIRVPRFDEHNEKAVGHSVDWFRMDARMVHQGKYKTLSVGAKLGWLWLLSEVAVSSSREAWVEPKEFARACHVKPARVPDILLELTSREWIQIVRTPYDTIRNDTNDTISVGEKPRPRTRKPKPEPQSSLPVVADGSPPGSVIGRYCSAYKGRYGTNPVIRPKQAGILTQLAKDLGPEKAVAVVEAYFQLPDSSLVKAAHPVEWIGNRLNEITRFMNTGQVVFRAQAAEVDREAALKQKNRKLQQECDAALAEVFGDQPALTGNV